MVQRNDKLLSILVGYFCTTLLWASILLLALLIFALLLRPDFMAAALFIPTWIWLIAGLAMALFGVFFHKRKTLLTLTGWFFFTLAFVEEVSSFGRYGLEPSKLKMALEHRDGRLVLVSLNCAGGASKAAEELAELNPDVAFLQERPTDYSTLREMADRICGPGSILVAGDDTAVIAKGKLVKETISLQTKAFAAHASIQTENGVEVSLYSLRLHPPEINTNLFSIECWQAHKVDRQNRRKQLQKVTEDLDGIPLDRKIILGGDFNVSAHDGSLRILNRRLTDSFIQAGFGNGNTATNWVPLFRIDQVWCSKTIKPSIVTTKKSKLSDHRIVIAIFDRL